jgi:hypothetical protein
VTETNDPVQHDRTLSARDRAMIRVLQQDVTKVFATRDVDPMMAFTVLLNVLGHLLGTQMTDTDRTAQTTMAVSLLPMYVEAYRIREKRI